MLKRIFFTSFTFPLILGACATNPDKIAAAYVSPFKYRAYNCDQLAEEMDYIGQRTLQLDQRPKADRDADNWQMGVELVLVWPALFALEGGEGPEATEYAQLKGEYEALRQTTVRKECSLEFWLSPEEIIQKRAEEDALEAEKY
tara:strand:- start:62 stop:493 length:432 start_codon:yes stop_codon:yes gene_type:complete